jgi:hypothetical protein
LVIQSLVQFEIKGKVAGEVQIFSTGALRIMVVDGDDLLLNILIVHQNENTNKAKEEAFDKLKEVLTRYVSSE